MAYIKISGVYKITNIINKKFYIGSSNNIKQRWREHRSDLRRNKHHNKHLQSAWNKYGEESFVFDIIEQCENYREREQFWIDTLQPYKRGIGYNNLPTVDTSLGYKLSEEQKENISKALYKRWENSSKKERQQISTLTRKMIEEHGIEFYVINRKLSDDDIRDIYTRINNGENKTDLQNEYDVDYWIINDIMSGKHWSHITGKKYIKQYEMLSKNDVLKIVELYNSGLSITDVSEKMNISYSKAKDIIRGKTWSNITGIKLHRLSPHKNGVEIIQLDENYNFIKEWESAQQVSNENSEYKHSSVCRACRNKTMYKGFYWIKKEDYLVYKAS